MKWVTVALRSKREVFLIVVLVLSPMVVDAGKFKPERYIAPSKMTDIFTRHIRKGLIKRIGLTDAQLVQIRDVVDPYRERLLTQIEEVKQSRMVLIEAVAAHPYDEKAVVSAHRRVAEAELDLTLSAGSILKKARKILTPEQISEVGQLMTEIRDASELRFLQLQENLSAGEMLGLPARSPEK